MTEPTNRRLDSWKEIADYLDRDVRTVIRWEDEKGLPVRRVPGGKRQGVFAYSEEIDRWMLGQVKGDNRIRSSDERKAPNVAPQTSRLEPRRSFSLRWILGIAAGLVLVVIGAGLWLDRPPSSAAGPTPLQRPLHFVRADYGASVPRGIAAADFNRDGKVDLVFTDSLDGNLVVLLGDGYGAFAQRVVSPTALKSPEHIAVGDFNSDGRLDVAVTSYFGGSDVEVLLGKGDGSFRQQARYDVGGRSRWLATGDLNGDGKLDLAVAASTAAQIIVLFGNGDGAFREGGRYEAERDVAGLALADVDGDGKLDIVANDYHQAGGKSVSVYRNAGDGRFSARQSFPAGDGPLGLAVADLNNDGRLDVVTANFPLGGSILFGSGGGRFAEAVPFESGRGNGFVSIADLDRDGAADLVVLGEHSNTATVLLGDGRGGFQRLQDLDTGVYPDGAVVIDLDRDRKPDLAVLNTNGNSISVFLNRTEETRASRGWLGRLTSRSTN